MNREFNRTWLSLDLVVRYGYRNTFVVVVVVTIACLQVSRNILPYQFLTDEGALNLTTIHQILTDVLKEQNVLAHALQNVSQELRETKFTLNETKDQLEKTDKELQKAIEELNGTRQQLGEHTHVRYRPFK